MQALVTQPGKAGTAHIEQVADPAPAAGEVLLRVVEVGVCGTDREIIDGQFGAAPARVRSSRRGHREVTSVRPAITTAHRTTRSGTGQASADAPGRLAARSVALALLTLKPIAQDIEARLQDIVQ